MFSSGPQVLPPARQLGRLVVDEAADLEPELAMVLELGGERLRPRVRSDDQDEALVVAAGAELLEAPPQEEPAGHRREPLRGEEEQQE